MTASERSPKTRVLVDQPAILWALDEAMDNVQEVPVASGPFDQYVWLLFVLVTSANGVLWWREGQKQIVSDPSLEAGYRRLVRGWLVFGNVEGAKAARRKQRAK